MLIMLILLNQIGDSWENLEMVLTFLTLLTFPRWESFFAPHSRNVNNVKNVKSIFSENCFGRGNVDNVYKVNNVKSYVGLLLKSGNGLNTINIISISPARNIFCFWQGKW